MSSAHADRIRRAVAAREEGRASLGTGVRVVVTDARSLPAARTMLEADCAEVDLACSRFRADSEICALRGGRPSRSARCSPRRSRWR
jgi:hypothetical protein